MSIIGGRAAVAGDFVVDVESELERRGSLLLNEVISLVNAIHVHHINTVRGENLFGESDKGWLVGKGGPQLAGCGVELSFELPGWQSIEVV